MALTMSLASVSFDRQPVAPNESIWVHSAVVGRFASTTILLSGKRRWSMSTSAGPLSAPKLSSTTAGECSSTAASSSLMGMSPATSSRSGSSAIRTDRPIPTRSSNLPATTVAMTRLYPLVGKTRPYLIRMGVPTSIWLPRSSTSSFRSRTQPFEMWPGMSSGWFVP